MTRSFEALEPRLQFAADVSVAPGVGALDTVDAPGGSVVLNARRTLYIGGTEREDSIRLRYVGNKLEIRLASQFDPSEPPLAHGILSDESELSPDAVSYSQTNQVGLVTRVYTIDPARVGRIFLDGRGGHDVARVQAVPIDVTPNDTERFDVESLPAPQGQKPWQPVARTDARWTDAVKRQLKLANASRATSAFVGDSHAERFLLTAPTLWKKHFASSLNLGIAGDSTQQLLWRIKHGLFDKFKPKTLVVMIGTNNLNTTAHSGTSDEIAQGVRTVVESLRAKLPDTRIVLFDIIPRRRAWQNALIVKVNQQSRELTADRRVQFVELYADLVGDPVRESLYVPLDEHLSAAGYDLLTQRLVRTLRIAV